MDSAAFSPEDSPRLQGCTPKQSAPPGSPLSRGRRSSGAPSLAGSEQPLLGRASASVGQPLCPRLSSACSRERARRLRRSPTPRSAAAMCGPGGMAAAPAEPVRLKGLLTSARPGTSRGGSLCLSGVTTAARNPTSGGISEEYKLSLKRKMQFNTV